MKTSAGTGKRNGHTIGKVVWFAVVVFGLTMYSPRTSHADYNQWTISYMAGYAWMDGDSLLTHTEPFTGELGSGPILSMRLRYRLNTTMSVEASALYGRSNTKSDDDNPDKLDVEQISPRLDLLLYPKRWGKFAPYIAIGGGALFIDREPRVNELRSGAKDVAPAGNVGLGVEYNLTRRIGLRLDGRGVGYDKGDGGLALNIEVSGGVTIGWGGDDSLRVSSENDKDRDGIPDEVDRCPDKAETRNQFQDDDGCPDRLRDRDQDGIVDDDDRCIDKPEDRDGFVDHDGCPEEDNDLDGILDAADKCPNEPETKNGVEDEDGCPEKDMDSDGIVDDKDRCPTQPETENKFEDEDGCPDVVPDTDEDRIPDNLDKCPKEKENYNGFEDSDGCPDELPKEVKKFTGAITGVTFVSGKSKLTVNAERVLLEAVKILNQYPDIQLRIEGHTDSRGRESRNLQLSEERAAAVRLFFIEQGIAASRLSAEGFGETRPVANNRSRRGRALNRRVEFYLVSSGNESAPKDAQ